MNKTRHFSVPQQAPFPANQAVDPMLQALLDDGRKMVASQPQKARTLWETGRSRATAVKNRFYAGRFAYNLGQLAYVENDSKAALILWREAIADAEAVGDTAIQGRALRQMGLIQNSDQQWETANTLLERAESLLRPQEPTEAASTAYIRAQVLKEMGRESESIPVLELVWTSLQTSDAYASLAASALSALALHYVVVGDADTALIRATKSAEIYARLGASVERAGALRIVGLAQEGKGHPKEAVRVYANARSVSEAASPSDTVGAVRALVNEARCWVNLTETDRARTLFTLAARRAGDAGLWRELGMAEENHAVLLRNRASAMVNLGDDDGARRLYVLTAKRFEAAADAYGRAGRTRNSRQASVSAATASAMAGQESGVDEPILAAIEDFRGQLQKNSVRRFSVDEVKTALIFAIYALAQVRTQRGVRLTIRGDGDAARLLFREAIMLRIEALGLARELPDAPLDLIGILYAGIASLQFEDGQYDVALQNLTQARECATRLGDSRSLGQWHAITAEVHLSRNDNAACVEHAEAARRLLESASQIVGDSTRVGAFQESASLHLYTTYALALVRLGHPDAALAVSDRGRAQGLRRQFLENRAALLAQFRDPDSREAWLDALRDFHAARAGLSALDPLGDEDLKAPRASALRNIPDALSRLEAATVRLDMCQQSLYRQNPNLSRLPSGPDPTRNASSFAKTVATERGTLYLEWTLRGDREGLLFAVAVGEPVRTYPISFAPGELRTKIRAWRASLEAPGRFDRAGVTVTENAAARADAAREPERARAVSDLLLGPLRRAGQLDSGRHSRLVIVADGLISEVPFAALLDQTDATVPATSKDRDARRLGERFAISYRFALATGTPTGDQVSSSEKSPVRGVCLSLAPFGSAPPPAPPKVPTTKQPAKGTPARSVLGSITIGAPELRSLTRATRSLRDNGLDVSMRARSQFLYGARARKSDFLRAAPGYALLLLATHGTQGLTPLESALSFAPEAGPPVSPAPSRLVDRLSAWEILSLPLRAQLAILGACDSGSGPVVGREGVMGFAWAFHAAGCQATVVTQWAADDETTGKILEKFVTMLVKSQKVVRKDDALRDALRGHLRDDSIPAALKHPYYWSLFQLIGDPTPLRLAVV